MRREIVTPVPGMVMAIHKGVGSQIQAGDALFTVSVMKTEFHVESEVEGVVIQIMAREGDMLEANTAVLVIDA